MSGNNLSAGLGGRRRSLIRLVLIVLIVGAVGCQRGALERVLILNDYTSPQELGPSFYDDAHYVGPSPVSELRLHYDGSGED